MDPRTLTITEEQYQSDYDQMNVINVTLSVVGGVVLTMCLALYCRAKRFWRLAFPGKEKDSYLNGKQPVERDSNSSMNVQASRPRHTIHRFASLFSSSGRISGMSDTSLLRETSVQSSAASIDLSAIPVENRILRSVSCLDQLQENKRLTLGFVDLCLTVPERLRDDATLTERFNAQFRPKRRRRITLLNNITGYFKFQTLSAIMGPSGCGKSTLLNTIAGRQKIGTLKGLRLINGSRFTIKGYNFYLRKQGFVLQQKDDFLFEEMTVLEELTYAALLRVPNSRNEPLQTGKRVMEVIDMVGCNKQANTCIKNLSGGQQRRLSVAIELLNTPSVIFLDEPTSGLDATASLQVLRLLRTLRLKGHTIILTIHQPREEIFDMIDKLLLMTKGGQVAYLGPVKSASEILHTRMNSMKVPSDTLKGCQLEKYHNHADYLLDAMSLDCILPEDWNRAHEESALGKKALRMIGDDLKNPVLLEMLKSVGYFDIAFVSFMRRVSSKHFPLFQWLYETMEIIVVCGFIAIAFDYQMGITGNSYAIVMYVFLLISYAFVWKQIYLIPMYISERKALYKEAASGILSISGYMTGTFIAEFLRIIWNTLLIIGCLYLFMQMNDETQNIIFAYVVLAVGTVEWNGVMSLIVLLTDSVERMYAASFMFLGLSSVFGGVMVSVGNITPRFLRIFTYTMPPAQTTRLILYNELYCCSYTTSCNEIAGSFGLPNRTVTTVDPNTGRLVLQSRSACPPIFDESMYEEGTINDGNLGRFILDYLGIDENRVQLIVMMLLLAMVFRITAWAVMVFRLKRQEQLVEDFESGRTARLKSMRVHAPEENKNDLLTIDSADGRDSDHSPEIRLVNKDDVGYFETVDNKMTTDRVS